MKSKLYWQGGRASRKIRGFFSLGKIHGLTNQLTRLSLKHVKKDVAFFIDSPTKYRYLVFILEKDSLVGKDMKEKTNHGC